jgi:Secretion system C-terminal sorting domain
MALFSQQGTKMTRFFILIFYTALMLSGTKKSFSQCIGNTFWVGGTPAVGTLTATGNILGTIQVNLRSQGSFASGRPGYSINTSAYGGFTYQSLMTYRGASFAAGTYTSFKLSTALDANYIHIRVSDIRGDGFNVEHQRVTGFLNGVSVPANFVDPQNGATVTGGNVINGAATTTALVQSSMRAFFTGPVDSIVVMATSLSDYVIVDLFARCDLLLPFQLLDFTARQNKNNIDLKWITTSEENIVAYNVERSTNGINWEKAGAVNANHSNLPNKQYQFTDQKPLRGKNYYRIASVETTGRFQYSPVLSITFLTHDIIRGVSVFPNPSNDHIVISADKNDMIRQVEIFAADGRLVKKITESEAAIRINTSDLIKGLYMLKVSTSDGQQTVHKMIRN